MPHLYFIPGTGADRRLFSRLDLSAFPSHSFLEWIPPLHYHETLAEYAKRLSAGIDTSKPFALVGVSLGGMVAVELAKILPAEKTVLISSVKTADELPWYFAAPRRLGLNHLLKSKSFKGLRALIRPFFGCETEQDAKLFDVLLQDASAEFLDWSIEAILHWTNREIPTGLVHIHGTHDLIFPARFLHQYIPIHGGKHFMIASKAKELSRLLERVIIQKEDIPMI